MADLFENPLGLDGFEFVEFCAPEKGLLEPVFTAMGFTRIAQHRSKDVHLWRQGDINLIANYEPASPAAYFAAEHGPSACGMGFRVKNARDAYKEALARGAEPVETKTGPMELRLPAIRGIGGAIIYLIDRYATLDNPDALSIYDIDFEYLPNVDRFPVGAGFKMIDHLTHNVYGGRMDHWAKFYERVFNFREIRFFDIKGEYTGLTSRAMTAPAGCISAEHPANTAGRCAAQPSSAGIPIAASHAARSYDGSISVFPSARALKKASSALVLCSSSSRLACTSARTHAARVRAASRARFAARTRGSSSSSSESEFLDLDADA